MKASKQNPAIIILLVSIIISCTGRNEERSVVADQKVVNIFENKNAEAFYDNLRSLCGKSFAGKEVYVQEGRESWLHLEMEMQVTVCDDFEVHIPFRVGENKSRTWMFFNENGKLRFRHDHRHEDGTPEDLTLYGGYSNNQGSSIRQEFPADDYTVEIHPRSEGAVWVVEFAEDMSLFCYQLYHNGNLLFQADFDLITNIKDKP